ncbi:hypothetical protein H4R33_001151 [Dimargaris cristalligena]|nr:hypothetical protein H4R33_001151 [Dimargaris cristalligena]
MYTVRLSVLAAALAWSSISVSALPPTYGVKRANVPSIPMNSFAALSMGDTDDDNDGWETIAPKAKKVPQHLAIASALDPVLTPPEGDVHGMADPLQV